MRVVCLLFEPHGGYSPARVQEAAESCYRLTPQIAVREGEAVFLEIGQCRKLFKEESLLLRLQALLRRFELRARVSVFHDAALALALARFPTFASAPYSLPLEALFDVAAPFKRDLEVDKQTAILIGILRKLGVQTLEEFMSLPPRALSSRFQFLGLELHRRLAAAKRHDASLSGVAWPAFVPAEKIVEKVNLHEHENCQNLEPLLFVMKTLVSRAMARLAGRGERVTGLELEFELEKYSTIQNPRRRWNFQLPLPQGSAAGLLPLIQEKLQGDLGRNPLASPVTGMEFRVLETAPGQYAQRNFFSKKEEEQEAWNSLMARLCQKLGKEHTFVASPVETYKPESSWERQPSNDGRGDDKLAEADLSGIELPLPQRPLRLLKKPQPLAKIHNALVQENPALEKRWEIQDWEGPERLTGEWWGEEFKRDYFRVGARNGEQLWIFRVPETDRIFLHGFFD